MYCFSHYVFPPSTYENVVLLANLAFHVRANTLFIYLFCAEVYDNFLGKAFGVWRQIYWKLSRRSFECRKTCIILSQSLKIIVGVARARLSHMVKAAWGQLLFTGSFKGSFSLPRKSEESAKLKLLCSYNVHYLLTSTFSQVKIWVEISSLCRPFSLLSCLPDC